jgi:hypothetical protein
LQYEKEKHLLTLKIGDTTMAEEFKSKNRVTASSSNKLQPSISLDEVRNLYDSGYVGRAKLREIGIGITLDGKVWDRNGAYIGEV